MHPFLTRLGVNAGLQEYLDAFYRSDEAGNLCFDYGADFEHYGLAFHRVPAVSAFWMAGNLHFAQVETVVIGGSALDLVAWLNVHSPYFNDRHSLLLLSVGASLSAKHIRWLREQLPGRRFIFCFSRELLGRLTSIKLSAGLRGQNLHIAFLPEEKVQILFRGRTWPFNPENLSVNALENLSGFRFRVMSSIPKNHNTFFEQLKAAAGLRF